MTHEMTPYESFTDQPTNAEMANEQLDGFIHNPGLGEMAGLFGVEDVSDDRSERLAELKEVSSSHWDFRKGQERQATDWDDELLSDPESEQWKTVFDAADKLGMVQSGEFTNKTPDYLVILGGANKAPLDRLRFGLESVDDCGHVVYLGSSRPVSDAEREKAKDYAPDAQTEFDLGSGAFETLLGARLVDEVVEERNGDTWGMRFYEYEGPNGETKQGFVLSTPQMIEGNRATTYDNFKFFAHQAQLEDNPGTTVGAVTTAFYAPAQHFTGVQELTLPYGAQLETIGHSAEYSGAIRKPTQLLQEAKAAIDAAGRLEQAINEGR